MAVKRPTSVLVIAILLLVFGIPGVLCGLCLVGVQAGGGIYSMAADFLRNTKEPEFVQMAEVIEARNALIEKEAPAAWTMETINAVAGLLLALVMVVAGIGLIRMSPWARGLSIIYGVAAILLTIFSIGYGLAVLGPIETKLQNELANKPDQLQLAKSMDASSPMNLASMAAGAILPIAVLLVMFSSTVGAAFRGELPPDTSVRDAERDRRLDEQNEEEEDGRWRR